MKKFFTIFILLTLITSVVFPTKVRADSVRPNADGSCPSTHPTRHETNFGIGCYSETPEQLEAYEASKESGNSGLFNLLNPAYWVTEALNLIGGFLLRIGALILIIVGLLFDTIIHWTIVDMAEHVGDTQGLGGGINAAWRTLRDLANIVFIFVLLWAAIQTILDLNASKFGPTIRNIIVVALLINFSLFFTKVVIDAANIATIGFYNSILAGSQAASVEIPPFGALDGFSAIFMQAVGIQNFWSPSALAGAGVGENITLFLTGMLGMVTMLIMAIVLIVTGVLFLTRYILLIFLMVLSPLAFIGYAVPGMASKFKEWWSALVNQAFFAPYFMVLIWVAIKLMAALGPNIQGVGNNLEWANIANGPKAVIALLLNFTLVIGFIVGALILSKKMASSTPFFKTISSGVGAVAVGGTAIAGRQTIGRAASRLEKNKDFQQWAAKSKFGTALYSGVQGTARSSFDARALGSTTIGKKTGLGNLVEGIGSAGGDGGFEKYKEAKTKEVTDKGKSFSDKQARATYAKRKANEWFTKGGSNSSPNTLFGAMGASNRLAAVALLDERIDQLKEDINKGRGELNRYNQNLTPSRPRGYVATAADLAASTLTPYEKQRYVDLVGGVAGLAITPGSKSIADMSTDLAAVQADKTAAGLDNTKRQQF